MQMNGDFNRIYCDLEIEGSYGADNAFIEGTVVLSHAAMQPNAFWDSITAVSLSKGLSILKLVLGPFILRSTIFLASCDCFVIEWVLNPSGKSITVHR